MPKKRTPPPPRLNSLRKKRKKWSFWRFLLKSFLFFIILCGLGIGGAYLVYSLVTPHYKKWAAEYDLETINELERPSIIYDKFGKEIGRIYDENRSYVPLNKVSPHMINALIAQEDARFRIHNGFDPIGIARAANEFAKSRSINQGASTVTQQLARNAFDLKKRAREREETGFGRKIVEIFLALRIEERYNKDQILEFYLNRVYLGSGYYGIRTASLGYFGKEPIDLTSREAASIAALIKNPNGLSPKNNPQENLKWRNHVLNRMALEGYLTVDEADRLKKMDLGLNPRPLNRGTSHIYERIKKQVSDYLGDELTHAGGLKIYTTIDKDIQDEAVKTLTSKLDEIEKRPGYNHPLLRNFQPDGVTVPKYIDGAALLIDNQTGGILAYVGGRDFTKRQYDAIETGSRPPGTAFLPFVYASAFENKFNPATKLMDHALDNRMAGIGGAEGILGEWGAESNKNRYEGDISARRALSASKIAATIRLGKALGSAKLLSTLQKFNLSLPKPETIGSDGIPVYRDRIFAGTEPLSLKELTRGFSAFATEGKIAPDIYVIDKINDETDYTIWKAPQSQTSPVRQQAVSPAAAYQVFSILRDSLETGSASQLKSEIDKNFEGIIKTGTNYGFTDNWCLATDMAVTGGVWIGFSEGRNAIYQGAFSVDTAGPVMADIINTTMKNYPSLKVQAPSDIDSVELCKVSGKRASRFCYEEDPASSREHPVYRQCTYTEYFRKGDISLPVCDVHAEDGMSLDSLMNTMGPNSTTRVLSVPPVIPQQHVLIGEEDPYDSEKVVIKMPTNYQYGTQGPVQAQGVVVEEEEGEEFKDARLITPPPPRIRLIKIPDSSPQNR